MFRFVWQCPLCLSDPTHHYFLCSVVAKLWNENNKRKEMVRIFFAICDQCGMIFQFSTFTDEYQKHYYQGQYRATLQNGDPGVTEKIIKIQEDRAKHLMPFLREVEDVKGALDIGSGTGALLKELRKEYRGCAILGVEPSPQFRDFSKSGMVADVANIDERLLGSFDLITMIHTLEHFIDPVGYLRSLHEYITDDGHLLVEVPNTYHEVGMVISHPVCFTEKTFRETLGRGGWKPLWIKTYKGNKSSREVDCNIVALCQPSEISHHIDLIDVDHEITAFYDSQVALKKLIEKQSG